MAAPFARLISRRAVAGGLAAASAARLAAHCLTDDASVLNVPPLATLDKLTFKAAFGGQFTVPRPAPWFAAKTATGGVEYADGISWQRGAFKSWWLRLGVSPTGEVPSAATVGAALDAVLALGKETADNVHKGTAVYVAVPELSTSTEALRTLYARGFRYHHYHAATSVEQPAEHVYYTWAGDPKDDLVPSYATSAEGVAAYLLSPDESRVLLVWEYGKWKPVSGHVDRSELSVRAAERELWEEVRAPRSTRCLHSAQGSTQCLHSAQGSTRCLHSAQGSTQCPHSALWCSCTRLIVGCGLCALQVGATVDQSFSPVMVGGFISSKSKDYAVNNNFHGYILRAANEEVRPDAAEVSEARWFDRTELREAWEAAGRPLGTKGIELPAASGLPEKQRKVMADVAVALSKFETGRGLVCTISGDRAAGKERMMF